MKVLKTGVEMTPGQLRKVKGGSCACGCEGGYTSSTLWTSSRDGDGCMCGCTSKDIDGNSVWLSPEISASSYPLP